MLKRVASKRSFLVIVVPLFVVSALLWSSWQPDVEHPYPSYPEFTGEVGNATTPAKPVMTVQESAPPVSVSKQADTPVGTGRISGRVFQSSGTPAVECDVLLYWSRDFRDPVTPNKNTANETDEPAQRHLFSGISTDDTGSFSIEALPSGWYAACARTESSCALQTVRLDETRAPTARVTLVLQQAGHIEGEVIDRSGTPIQGVDLIPTEHDGDSVPPFIRDFHSVISDPEGRFRIANLAFAEWNLRAVKDGYSIADVGPFPVEGESVTIVLDRGGSLSGTIMHTSGETVPPGVRLVALDESGSRTSYSTISGSCGEFQFANLAEGVYSIEPDDGVHVLAEQTQPIQIEDGETYSDVILMITVGGIVSGRVLVDESGAGVTGVRLGAMPLEKFSRPGYSDATDEEGNYQITGLTAGTYTVRVIEQPPEIIPPSRHSEPRIVASLGKTQHDVDIYVSHGKTVSGFVVNQQGSPVAEARINARMGRSPVPFRTGTNDLGEFFLNGLRVGPDLAIEVEANGYARSVSGPHVVPDEGLSGLEIVLEESKEGVIAGQVVTASGNPLRAAVVCRLMDEIEHPATSQQVISDHDGNFVVPIDTPRSYHINFGPVDGEGRTYVLVDGGTYQLRTGESRTGIRLVYSDAELLTISGHVRTSHGLPISRARVSTVQDNHMRGAKASTDENGEFVLRGISDGQYTLWARHEQYGTAVISGVGAGDSNIVLQLQGPPRIQGTVMSKRDGKPVGRFEVAIAQSGRTQIDDATYKTFTTSDGKFSIEGPVNLLDEQDEADYVVCARAPGYSSARVIIGRLQSDTTIEGVLVLLDAASASLEGVVCDTARSPIPNALILEGGVDAISSRSTATPLATTDAEGKFRIADLSVDLSCISVFAQDYGPEAVPILLQSGATSTISVTLEPGGEVAGFVTCDGTPVKGAVVRARSVGAEPVTTDDEGRYRITGLPRGIVVLRAQLYGPSASPESKPPSLDSQASIESGGLVNVNFEFESFDSTVGSSL